MVTKRYVSETFHISVGDVAVLNPPVDSVRINRLWRNSDVEKENLAVCIGRLELDKKFVDVLYAMAKLRNGVKLDLIGFSEAESKLAELIRNLGFESNVKLLINVSRETIINELIRAKAIIHPTSHEPFGIAVVEGMAAGCIPIVRKGFNGPWMEITQEEKYGLGFSSIDELSYMLMKAIRHYDDFDINAITSRALEFDKTAFKNRFLRMLKDSMTNR